MEELTIGAVEARFADLIWENEPVSSGELVKIAREKLEWKKSTTYTVLRRLSEKGLFQNKDGIVTHILTRDEFYALQSEQIVESAFKGSLPAFVAAFSSRKNLSSEEIRELKAIIDNILPASEEES